MAETVRRSVYTHNWLISHCAISGKTRHRQGAVEIGGAQREGHGPGTTRASPEEKPRDSPAPGLHSRTHSLDPSTGGNDITRFCPKNSEARNVIPAVGITYIRASHSLSRIFEFCRITDQRGPSVVSRADEYRAQAAECLRHANQTRDPETKRQYEDLARQWQLMAERAEKQQR